MEISKYALFVDLANTKNLTKSGERLGYTQPGVSHVLKTIENELGFPLFIRTKRGVELTPNAETILPLVRQILAVNEQLDQVISDINGLVSGHLTIATFASISRSWLPQIIYKYQKMYPGIEIELLEGGTDDIVSWVGGSQADIGLMSERHSYPLSWIPLYEDSLMAILPKDFPITGDAVPMRVFEENQFIISAEGVDYDVHFAIDDAKISPNICYSSTDDHTVISMVANKLGVSILPNLVIGTAHNKILALPLEPHYFRVLGIASKPDSSLSPAAKKFVKVIQDELPEIIKQYE